MINPVQDITPDGRPIEGTTYPEHPTLGVSLDSGLRAGMSSIEPTRQSVLDTLSVIRPDETDRPEHPALASQMHHKRSCLKSSARPMPDPDLNDHTDVNEDINTDLPERCSETVLWRICHPMSLMTSCCHCAGGGGGGSVAKMGLVLLCWRGLYIYALELCYL